MDHLDQHLDLGQIYTPLLNDYPFNFVFLVRLETKLVREVLHALVFQHQYMLVLIFHMPRLGVEGRKIIVDTEKI
jgi:hypothetical protein